MTHPIEWCTMTVNPITGCRSTCPWCYARRMARRLGAIPGTVYHRLRMAGEDPFTPAVNLEVLKKVEKTLTQRRLPQRVFLCSMGEIGSERFCRTGMVGDPGVDMDVYTVFDAWRYLARLCRGLERHTFLLLTKNPGGLPADAVFYPPNMQVGVTVTAQADAWRLDVLRNRLPVWVPKWLCLEPLLDARLRPPDADDAVVWTDYRWIVLGAQTGPGAPRRLDPSLEATARAWCAAAARRGIPVFVKRNLRERAADGGGWPQEILPWTQICPAAPSS